MSEQKHAHIASHTDAKANGELASPLTVHKRAKIKESKKIMIPGRIRRSILNQIFKFVNRNYVGNFLVSLLLLLPALF